MACEYYNLPHEHWLVSPGMSGLLWVPWVSLQLSLHPEFPSVLEAYSATGDRILTNSGLN